MSHSDKGFKLVSHLTRKEYPYDGRDPDGSSKRNALAAMAADDATIKAANNARALPVLNRELTEREHRAGNWQPDTRTPRERVMQETTHHSQATRDPDRDVQGERVAQLQQQLARTMRAEDKTPIQRRIDLALAESAKFQAARDARKEREALLSSSEVQTAIVLGQAWVARLETNPTCPQEWVDGAKSRLDRLKRTGDTDSFYRDNDAFEAERKSLLDARTQALDAEAAAVRAEAAAMRREAKAEVVTELAPVLEPTPV